MAELGFRSNLAHNHHALQHAVSKRIPGVSNSALLTLGAGCFFHMRGCPGHRRMFISISDLYLLAASSKLPPSHQKCPQKKKKKKRNVPRHCQMSWAERGRGVPECLLRTTVLMGKISTISKTHQGDPVNGSAHGPTRLMSQKNK